MLSRNLVAKTILKNQLQLRYGFGKDKNPTASPSENREERREVIQRFKESQANAITKRVQFTQTNQLEGLIIEDDPLPLSSVCTQFDTDFETSICDYTVRLTLLGEFAIFENFETRTDDDIGGDMVNVNPFKIAKDFETGVLSSSELFLTDYYLDVNDFETFVEPISSVVVEAYVFELENDFEDSTTTLTVDTIESPFDLEETFEDSTTTLTVTDITV